MSSFLSVCLFVFACVCPVDPAPQTVKLKIRERDTISQCHLGVNYIHLNSGKGSNAEQRQLGIRGGDEIGGQPRKKHIIATGIEREDQIQMALVLEVENVKCFVCACVTCFMICY